MSKIITALGAQFPPAYHRPWFRYIEGEAGGAPVDPPAPAEPTPPPAAPAPPAPTPQQAAPAAPAPIAYKGDPDEYVRELREEAKTHRLAAEKAAQERDAEKTERENAAAAREQLARENHILRVAPKFGANPDLLLDSSSFMKNFADVDLAKEDDVKKAIEDALERNSAFRAGPALPPSSGGGHQGGSPNSPTPTLEGAVKARLGG